MPRSVQLPPDERPVADGAKAGGWWHESEDGRKVVCDLCPRGCSLGPEVRGFCFVRQNRGGRMTSTTYGRSTGFCIDPIEKKPLNQFYPGTPILSFGTAGCNLGCKFCQNWTSSKSRQVDAYCEVADPESIARAARELDCRSVAFTYNDPIVWAEYAIDTARECHKLGIKTVAVTSGYITPIARQSFFEVMDAANVDLKAFTEQFYRELTGGHLEPVLDTLRWLAHESDVWVEITNLIIPRANDSPDELKQMSEWIVEELGPDVPIHFTAFHPDFELTDRGPTPPQTLVAAHDIARQAGLRYVYTGNISDRTRQSTHCPKCGKVVIEREGYYLGKYALRGNRCGHCGAEVAGRFDEMPGQWGAGRKPVRIAAFAQTKPTESAGENTMEDKPSKQPDVPHSASERPGLDSRQEERVFHAAGERVAAAVNLRPPEPMNELLGDMADVPVLGAFVSLKRGGQLRSCCGFLGESVSLAQALDSAALRAAKEDPRFPPISPTELDDLDMEVWLLWNLQPVTARGEDRIRAVTIGKHGLQIIRGPARGLLLPGVATDHGLDAEGFLRQVCLKAQLRPDAWKDDSTTLMTFEGHPISGRLGLSLPADEAPAATAGPTRADLALLADFCRQNLVAMAQGATPNCYLTGGFDGGVNGMVLAVGIPGYTEKLECSQLSLRPEVPLQSTLFRLVEAIGNAVRRQRVPPDTLEKATVDLTVFWDPAMHGTAGRPNLEGVDPKQRAVVVFSQSQWACVYDPDQPVEALLAEAVREARLAERTGLSVFSLATVSTERRAVASNVPKPQVGPEVRAAAVAGQFYPGSAEEIARAVDDLLPEKCTPERWAGAMVPHAGWVYSGRLAAEVFSRIAIPGQTIIFCPRHSRGGARWAVAPHRKWSLPGCDLDSDPELAAQLAEGVSGLELDAAAHQAEHSIEVQLPILARLAPETRVVGVAIGGGNWPSLERFAEQLAGVLAQLAERPLLVISTDMNHYADDTETRRLDRMALDAVESLDPLRLYETVTENRISMCGILPAVLVMETLRRMDRLNQCEPVGYATSAEASGDERRVVGYAGMLFK